MSKVTLSGTWIIKAPIDKVYDIVSDFENAPKYFPIVAKSMKILEKNGNHLHILAASNTLGLTFKVNMETDLLPNKGFKSINESLLAIENEELLMTSVLDGTKIDYTNIVTIKNNFLNLFSKILIGKPALKFWEWAYINRLRKIVE